MNTRDNLEIVLKKYKKNLITTNETVKQILKIYDKSLRFNGNSFLGGIIFSIFLMFIYLFFKF